MFLQSKRYPQMIELVGQLKDRRGLKIAVVSNEGRELNAYRIRTFKLEGFVDSCISSCRLSTVMAGAEMSLSSVSVISNALRLRKEKLRLRCLT
jgi:hypothetical protein